MTYIYIILFKQYDKISFQQISYYQNINYTLFIHRELTL